jgi:proteasome lid subunit RPN8/RPN11
MIELTSSHREALIAHARDESPNECCGLLVGAGNRVQRIHRTANAEHSPVTYRVDPRDLLRIFQELDDAGLEMVGIYHSHTHSPAYPSPTDVGYARGYPEAAYVIVSLADPAAPVVRSFRITDGRIAEEEVVLRETAVEDQGG